MKAPRISGSWRLNSPLILNKEHSKSGLQHLDMPVTSKPPCPWTVPCVLWRWENLYAKLFCLTFIPAEALHSTAFENTQEEFEQHFCFVSTSGWCFFSHFFSLLRTQAWREDFFLLLNSSSTSYSFLPIDLIIPCWRYYNWSLWRCFKQAGMGQQSSHKYSPGSPLPEFWFQSNAEMWVRSNI